MKRLFFILISIAMISCEKENNIDAIKPGNVKSMNISGADYLAIGSTNLKSTGSNWSNLYKLTIDGSELQSEKVGFYDSNGNIIDSVFTTINIDNIYPISENFLCLTGSFTIQIDSVVNELSYSSLLVNKATGDVYDFNGQYPYQYSYYLGSDYIQSDSSGNLYYHYENPIYLLNLSNESLLSQETYLSGSQYNGLDYFYISPNGNCYYDDFPNTKIKLASGGIITADRYLKNYFTSPDNKSYCVINNEIGQIDVIDNSLSYTKVGEIADWYDNEKYSYNYNTDNFSMMLMDRIGENNIIGDIFFYNPFKTYSVKLPSAITNEFNIVGLASENIYVVSTINAGKEFYKFKLNSIAINDNSSYIVSDYSLLKFPDTYEINNYKILDNGDISFIGYDLSNEKDISGILSSDGDLIITNVSSDYKFEILQKLN